jgi:hypothetical protein
MPQAQGAGTVYVGGPGGAKRGPLYMKRWPSGANGNIQDFVQLFDANGNLVSPIGSSVIIPSANIDPQVIQYKKVTLTPAQVLLLFTTPISLIAAPGAGKFIQVLDALFFVQFGTAQYTAGGVVSLVEGAVNIATTTAALINGAAANLVIQPAFPLLATSNSVGTGNSAVTIQAATQNFASGDSPIDVHLWYAVVTL